MGAVKRCPDCAQRFPGKLAGAGVLASVCDFFGLKVFWTSEVEEAFDSGTVRFPDLQIRLRANDVGCIFPLPDAQLPDYAKKLSQQILDLIMLLRKGVNLSAGSSSSATLRKTCSCAGHQVADKDDERSDCH